MPKVTYVLERSVILSAMIQELERRAISFNKELLESYVDQRVNYSKQGINPVMKWKPKIDITKETLLSYVKEFLGKRRV